MTVTVTVNAIGVSPATSFASCLTCAAKWWKVEVLNCKPARGSRQCASKPALTCMQQVGVTCNSLTQHFNTCNIATGQGIFTICLYVLPLCIKPSTHLRTQRGTVTSCEAGTLNTATTACLFTVLYSGEFYHDAGLKEQVKHTCPYILCRLNPVIIITTAYFKWVIKENGRLRFRQL